MSLWNRVMLATATGVCLAFGVGYFLARSMPFWATVGISYVSGMVLLVVVLAAAAPRRSRRTKHRHGR